MVVPNLNKFPQGVPEIARLEVQKDTQPKNTMPNIIAGMYGINILDQMHQINQIKTFFPSTCVFKPLCQGQTWPKALCFQVVQPSACPSHAH